MRLSVCVFTAMCIALGVQAQTPAVTWIKKNGPIGGQIHDIEVDPATGKVYLLDSNQDPYVSSDNGNTWQALTFAGSDEYFTDIEITNGTIFLVGAYELFASTDGGATFLKRMGASNPYNDVSILKRAPASGDLVALSYSGLYVSTDNGVNWTLKNNSLGQIETEYLAINSVDQIFILKVNQSTFNHRPFRSVDGGATFTEASTNIPGTEITHSLYADNTGSKIYCVTGPNIYSSSNGTDWVSIKTGSITDLSLSDYGYLQKPKIEFSADGLGMYFIDNNNQKLHAKTLAATDWTLRASDFPGPGLGVTCATALNYNDPASSTVYFGSPAGVFKSTTGGASISQSNTGITGVSISRIFAAYNSYLYIDGGVVGWMKSTDEGDAWSRITNINRQINYFFDTPHGEFSPEDVFYGDALFAITDENKLLRSTNDAASWFDVSPSGGLTWAGGIGASKVFGLQNNFSPASFYYSYSNGSSWTATPIAITGLPTDFYINSDRIVLASEGRMFLPIQDYSLNTTSIYRIDFTYDVNENITSAVATAITSPIPYDDVAYMTGANGRLYLYNRYNAGDAFAVSSDGGSTWSTPALPFQASNAKLFASPNGYLFFADGSADKLFMSRDDGATFIELALPASVDGYSVGGVALDREGIASLAVSGDYLYRSSGTLVLPPPVTDLQGVGYSHHSVALRWLDMNEADHTIAIERSVNGIDFQEVGTRDGWDKCYNGGNYGFFVDTQVEPSTQYTYRVVARNTAGDSEPTGTVMVTTGSACTPTLPDNRSWSAINTGGDGHAVLGSPVTVAIKHLGDGKYRINNLSLGLTGEVEDGIFFESCGVTAVGSEGNEVNPNGNGSWDGAILTLKWRDCNTDATETITLTLNADDPAPVKPATPFVHVLSNSSIEVKWSQGYYESAYIIERSATSASLGFTEIATINYPETVYIDADPSLTLNTTYYYRIRTVNGNAVPLSSPNSDAASVLFQRPNFVVANNAVSDYYAATIGSIWADFNNDDLQDYMTMDFDIESERAVPVIFKNLGSGAFEKITTDFGNATYLFPSVADFDNDKYPDILLAGDESFVLDIFKGNGDFTFTKLTGPQLGDLAALPRTIMSASWGAADADGLLDVVALFDHPGGFALYSQNPNHTFSKTFEGTSSSGASMIPLWADYDNDGDQDFLATAFDGGISLYRNEGDRTFTEVLDSGLELDGFIAAAWGDYDHDGDLDLFCGLITQNALFRNNGDGTFAKDVSTSVSEANFSLSASWGDYNNDGFLDLITASIPLDEGSFAGSPTRLFLRDPSVTTSVSFKKVINEKLSDRSVGHYSLSTADFDQDGRLDAALSSIAPTEAEDFLPAENTMFRNNNAAQNWSEVKLVAANGNSEVMGARIVLTAGGRTHIREFSPSTSFVSRNSTVAHFGLGSTNSITNIQIRWPNGGVQNYPLPPVNQLLVIEEDVTGPTIAGKTPEHNAIDVATTTTLTLQFNEEAFGVSGKTVTITKIGEGAPFATVNANAGAKTGNQITYSLPAELEGETQYRITIEAGAFRDRWLNPSLAVGPLEWWFTTDAAVDAEAPAITPFVPPASLAKSFATISPSITVTDNVGVENVVVSIRKISGSSFTDVNATPTGTANTFSATLSEGTHFDATGAEFFITATDAAGNTSRDPANPDNTHKVFLTYDETQSAIPSSALGFGGTKQSWKIFTIPFELVNPNNSVNNIFNEFSSLTPKTDYRLITINDARDGWKESPAFTDIARGQGYFINIKNVTTIKLYNDLKAPTNSRANLYQMNLAAGWNMIGNPYLSTISWDDVATLNGLSGTEGQLKTYSNGNYNNDQILGPFEGGFVLMTAAKTISIPFEGQTSSGGRKGVPSLSDDINAEAWALSLTLRQNELTYSLGGVGMAPEADESIDNYDDVTPPRFIDFLELNFDHPEHIAKRFTRDIVPTQENYIWDFTVDSNLEGMAELLWNNAPLMTSGKDIFLLDVNSQTLVNMKETGSVKFDPRSSRRFRIYFGENLKISPEAVHLGRAYPNPASGLTTIAFSLPETGGLGQSVTLDIVDAMGHVVGTIQQGRYDPGFHQAAVDVSEITKGFYTYRLSVQNHNGRTIEVNKLIIK